MSVRRETEMMRGVGGMVVLVISYQ